MYMLKRTGVLVLSLLLATALSLLVVAIVFTQLFSQPSTVKDTLHSADVYDSFVDTVTEEVSTQTGDLINVSDEEMEAMVRDSLTPEIAQEQAEDAIDAIYVWLEGEAGTPEFVLDFSDARESLAMELGNHVREELEALPACTSPAQIPASGELEDFTCIPPGFDIDSEVNQLVDETLESDDFIADVTFTSDDMLGDMAAFQADSKMPTVFQFLSQALWPLVVVIVAASALIVALSKTKRLGMRRVGWQFISAGVGFLLISGLLWAWLWSGMAFEADQATTYQLALVDAAHIFINKAFQVIAITAAAIFVLGVILRALFRKKKEK